jgi:hypothetical protein
MGNDEERVEAGRWKYVGLKIPVTRVTWRWTKGKGLGVGRSWNLMCLDAYQHIFQ